MRASTIAGALVLVILAAAAVWKWPRHNPTPHAAVHVSERVRPAGCNPLPTAPPLPAALSPETPTLDGVVRALNASLGERHRALLRCFSDDADLIASTQFGMGRWLRGTLHLYRTNPLTQSLRATGATGPDEMSALIVRAYAQSLGAPVRVSDGALR